MTASGVSKNLYCFTWCRYRLRRLCRLSTYEDATSSWRITLITEHIKNKRRKRKRKNITDCYLWKYKQDVSQQISSSFLLRFLKVFPRSLTSKWPGNKIIDKTEQLQLQWWAPCRHATFSTYCTGQIHTSRKWRALINRHHMCISAHLQCSDQRYTVQVRGKLSPLLMWMYKIKVSCVNAFVIEMSL